MINIDINSYPRSGNNFAKRTCERYLNDSTFSVFHEIQKIGGKQITIFRDPAECVASNAYRFAVPNKHVQQKHGKILLNQTSDFYLREYVALNLRHYNQWIQYLGRLKNAMIVDFKVMSQDPKKFIADVSNFFSLETNDRFTSEDIKKTMDELMKTHHKEFYPRQGDDIREKINRFVLEDAEFEKTQKKYLEISYTSNIVVN